MSDYRIRYADPSDAEVIASHRVAMFQAMGELDGTDVEAVASATRERVAAQLASGEYTGWLVEINGVPIAGAGVLLHQYHPTRQNPDGRPTAYILNVYTDPLHRRAGLATRLIETILAWCHERDIPRASLHTSEWGRPVYERLGFAPTHELRLDLRKPVRTGSLP
jgi:GNAT superfamily N-acetyltransferase